MRPLGLAAQRYTFLARLLGSCACCVAAGIEDGRPSDVGRIWNFFHFRPYCVRKLASGRLRAVGY